MTQHFSRREFLVSSLGTAGVLASGGRLRAETDEKVYYPSAKLPAALPNAPVAIERCRSYDPAALREKLDAAFNLIGGLKKLVGNKTVSIKINVTGGPEQAGQSARLSDLSDPPQLVGRAVCGARSTPVRGG